MQSLEPLINLLVLLTVLSVAAERATNIIKLRVEATKTAAASPEAESVRAGKIAIQSTIVGVLLCLLVKADLFAILASLDDPWKSLGWVQSNGESWYRASSANVGALMHTIGGCALTGVALGFGSKFWHDVLGVVYEIKKQKQLVSEGKQRELAKPAPEDDHDGGDENGEGKPNGV